MAFQQAFYDPVLAAIFSSALTGRKEVGTKTVSSNLGKLSCRVVVGSGTIEAFDLSLPYKLELWLHAAAPFGVVGARMDVQFNKATTNGKPALLADHYETYEVSIADFGEMDPKGRPKSLILSRYRTWTDSTGQFKIKARYIRLNGTIVVLQRDDNKKELRVPIVKLSKSDQELLRSAKK